LAGERGSAGSELIAGIENPKIGDWVRSLIDHGKAYEPHASHDLFVANKIPGQWVRLVLRFVPLASPGGLGQIKFGMRVIIEA
jgi:hypothetical protein